MSCPAFGGGRDWPHLQSVPQMLGRAEGGAAAGGSPQSGTWATKGAHTPRAQAVHVTGVRGCRSGLNG